MAVSNTDDWRINCNDFTAVLNKAREEARFTDVQFVMGKGSTKKVFNAHKAILACGSPGFEKMFYGTSAETKSVIETDDDPEAFEMLLNHIYGNDPELSSLNSAWKYFVVGDKYLVTKVQETAKEYIQKVSITGTHFWDLIRNNLFTIPLFTEQVISYMESNTRKITASENFLNVPEYIINTILQMEKLSVSEYDLLLAVTKWGYKNVEHASSKDFIKFYRHIRFSTLTVDDFFKFIGLYPEAIDAQSSLEILQYLRKAPVCNLPEWCSTNKISRGQVPEIYYRRIRRKR